MYNVQQEPGGFVFMLIIFALIIGGFIWIVNDNPTNNNNDTNESFFGEFAEYDNEENKTSWDVSGVTDMSDMFIGIITENITDELANTSMDGYVELIIWGNSSEKNVTEISSFIPAADIGGLIFWILVFVVLFIFWVVFDNRRYC